MLNLDRAILASLGAPGRNLIGAHGPRCAHCAGLGQAFRLGRAHSWVHTRPTACAPCKSTGLDLDALQRSEMADLATRLHALEKQEVERLRRIRELETRAGISPYAKSPEMSSQSWMESIAWATADGTAIANTTTEAVIFPNITIPAGYMQDGRVISLSAYGRISTTGTPTGTWSIRWGGISGTLLWTTEAITQGSGVTNVNWEMTATLQTRSNGSAGSMFLMGSLVVHTSSTAVVTNIAGISGYDAPAVVSSLDLTTDTALSIGFDWSAASASNTLTGHMYNVRVEN